MLFPLTNDSRHCYINGKWREGRGESLEVLNPSTNESLFTLGAASAQDVDDAVSAAWQAFRRGPWSSLTGIEKAKLLNSLAALIRDNLEGLAELEAKNTGIPIRQSRFEVESAAGHIEYFAGLAGKVEGMSTPVPGNRFAYTIREPLGVIGQSVPWNSPLKLMARGCAATLAAGNTLVIKPSAVACTTVLMFGKLIEQAGFPVGVVNIVPGPGRTTGAALVAHPGVRKLVFIGGTEGGREVLRAASENITPVLIELGGKGPIIVCEDVDIDEAVKGVISQAFARQGEVCFAGTRLFLPGSMHDTFVERLAAKLAAMKVGDAMDESTDMGPLISKQHLASVMKHIENAKSEGAKLVGDGGQLISGTKGNFMTPGLLVGASQDMRIAREEVFGPIIPVIPYSDIEEAIAMANATEYGLASYVWANDIRKAHTIAAKMESGNVFVNTYRYSSEVPFGGSKRSGYGREHGMEALREHTQVKTILIGLDRWHDAVMDRDSAA
jgi:acyl-CoA reductase-like NAD-dependent aldehyde dehydrogenase